MNIKSFLKKTLTLTTIIYTVSMLFIVIVTMLGGANQAGEFPPIGVDTHLFFLAFSLFSAISITIAKFEKIPSSAKYFIEGGGMATGFLLFVVLTRDGMQLGKACAWTLGFIAAYAIVRVVIAILRYDEKGCKKKVKENKKTRDKTEKKAREDALYGKTKKSEPEYTNLFSSDKK